MKKILWLAAGMAMFAGPAQASLLVMESTFFEPASAPVYRVPPPLPSCVRPPSIRALRGPIAYAHPYPSDKDHHFSYDWRYWHEER